VNEPADVPSDGFHDVDGMNPTSLRHIIGQKNVVEQLKVAIDYAQIDRTKVDHALLVGPPGLGKTSVAHVIAFEMASTLHEVLGQSITSRADLNALLLGAQEKDVVFVDESHELPKKLQTSLYTAIDQKRLIVDWGTGPQSIPVADFTLLLATTDEHRLLKPLRDRMKITLRFDFYHEEELAQLLRLRSLSLGWSIEDEAILKIAKRSQGTARLALRLLQSCRRVCTVEGGTTITVAHLVRASTLAGIDELGLGALDQQYLRKIRDGSTQLHVIAAALGLNPQTVADVIEPFLFRCGLVAKDGHSRRRLTPAGREHVSTCCEIRG